VTTSPSSPRRLAVPAVALLATLTLAACGSDTTTVTVPASGTTGTAPTTPTTPTAPTTSTTASTPTVIDTPTPSGTSDGLGQDEEAWKRAIRSLVPDTTLTYCEEVGIDRGSDGEINQATLECKPFSDTTVSYLLTGQFASAKAAYTRSRDDGTPQSDLTTRSGDSCNQAGDNEVRLEVPETKRVIGWRSCRQVGDARDVPQFEQLHRGPSGTGLLVIGTEQDKVWGSLVEVMNKAVLASRVPTFTD